MTSSDGTECLLNLIGSADTPRSPSCRMLRCGKRRSLYFFIFQLKQLVAGVFSERYYNSTLLCSHRNSSSITGPAAISGMHSGEVSRTRVNSGKSSRQLSSLCKSSIISIKSACTSHARVVSLLVKHLNLTFRFNRSNDMVVLKFFFS